MKTVDEHKKDSKTKTWELLMDGQIKHKLNTPRRCHNWSNMACKWFPTNKNNDALPSSSSVLSPTNLCRRSCSMKARWMYDADDDEGMGLTPMKYRTSLQYSNQCWHELLWLVWHHSKINMILETGDNIFKNLFRIWFLSVSKLIWPWLKYT